MKWITPLEIEPNLSEAPMEFQIYVASNLEIEMASRLLNLSIYGGVVFAVSLELYSWWRGQ